MVLALVSGAAATIAVVVFLLSALALVAWQSLRSYDIDAHLRGENVIHPGKNKAAK